MQHSTVTLIVTLLFSPLIAGRVLAQIFVSDRAEGGRIGAYNFDGTPINPSLITGIGLPSGIAIAGSDIFVALPNLGKVGRYTTSGATVNSAFLEGLVQPFDVAVVDQHLYVASYNSSNGVIGKYTLDGTAINSSLISGLDSLFAIAIDKHIFTASHHEDTNTGRVGKFHLDGTPVNPALISDYRYPSGIEVSGSFLYVANGNEGGDNGIRKFDLNGALQTAYTPVVHAPSAVAAWGGHLYVTDGQSAVINGQLVPTGGIARYNLDGSGANLSFISGLHSPEGIATVPENIPLTAIISLTGAFVLLGRRAMRCTHRRHAALNESPREQ